MERIEGPFRLNDIDRVEPSLETIIAICGKYLEPETKETSADKFILHLQIFEKLQELEATGKVERFEIKEPGFPSVVVYRRGKNPLTVITAGSHGDEGEPILPLIEEIIKRLENDEIDDFLFIPIANPLAFANNSLGIPLDPTLARCLHDAGILDDTQFEVLCNDNVAPVTIRKALESSRFLSSHEFKYVQTIKDQALIDSLPQLRRQLFVKIMKALKYPVADENTSHPAINLNRQFTEIEDFIQPPLESLFPVARQLIKALAIYAPNALEGHSFHADNEQQITELTGANQKRLVQGGGYSYDTPLDEPSTDSPEEIKVRELFNAFQTEMRRRNLPLLTGFDDINDDDLRYIFGLGYAMVPANEVKRGGKIIKRTGAMHDKSFETSMVRWGIVRQRYWCHETSGWIAPERRAEMIKVFFDCLVIPLMRFRKQQYLELNNR